MIYGGMYQLLVTRAIEVENEPDVVVPPGTIVKTVPLSELEQQLPNIAKYQVVEVAFPDEEVKKEFGLDAIGAAQGKTTLVSLGREFIAAEPERLQSLGVLKPVNQPVSQ